jgi:two-component system response regulator AtoC
MAIRIDGNLLSAGMNGPPGRPSQYFVRGTSPVVRALERTVADIASTDIPVLLVGESGTGKEIVALEIHGLSRRWNEPFVKCGCAGLTGDALALRLRCGESAADGDRATNGSLYLDGINHLDPGTQARLLQLLPDGDGRPPQGYGSVRVISSVTRNLDEELKSGQFREELYYRINGVHLRLPPLRERTEDIPALLEFFLRKYATLFERPAPKISESTMDLLAQHSWPGNIRELENVVRKFVALGDEHLAVHGLSTGPSQKPSDSTDAAAKNSGNGHSQNGTRSLKEAAREASRQAERTLILSQLERTHWNRKRAARELQISYKALLYKLKQLGLEGSGHSEEQ